MEMIQQEFIESTKWAAMAFICGVFLREFAPDTFGKWLGRSGVLAALFVSFCFSEHAMQHCSRMGDVTEIHPSDSDGDETIIASSDNGRE